MSLRTLLYTGHDATYAPLAAITVPRMQSYALKYDYDFMCYTKPLIDVPNGIYWTGVCGALQAFEKGYDRAIYLDVDMLITNFDFSVSDQLKNFEHGLHMPRDWGDDAVEDTDVSACFLATHKLKCLPLLEEVLSMEPEWRDKPFPEQGPLRDVVKRNLRSNRFDAIAWAWDRKPFNCVYGSICPGQVPEPWVKSDWCCHLTMAPLKERIRMAAEILNIL